MKMIITVGIPGCGKSKWGREQEEAGDNIVVVERDIIRAQSHTESGNKWDYKFSKAKEKHVTKFQEAQIRNILSAGLTVIVADTNLNPGTRNRITAIANEYGIEAQTEVFDVPFHKCLKWNANRPDHVPESVMIRMEQGMRKYMNKYVQTPEGREQEGHMAHSCVIMDIDGTLADMKGLRGPYDWQNVHLDRPIKHVVDYARYIVNNTFHDLIIFSGRDSECRYKTAQWLKDHGINYDELYMRPEGSTINDSILKEQMYMDHVHDIYNVDHIVDDRKQVCLMWESMGFRVMNVGGFLSDF